MPEFTVSIKEKIPMDLLITSTSICKGCLKTRRNFPIAFYQCFKRYPGDAWIKKYIFPGGVVPGLREIMYIAGDKRFYTVGSESLRRHYNHTLLYWNKISRSSSGSSRDV